MRTLEQEQRECAWEVWEHTGKVRAWLDLRAECPNYLSTFDEYCAGIHRWEGRDE